MIWKLQMRDKKLDPSEARLQKLLNWKMIEFFYNLQISLQVVSKKVNIQRWENTTVNRKGEPTSNNWVGEVVKKRICWKVK